MRAIVISACGGPEVLRYAEHPDPVAGPGQAVVDVEASGVNFIDVYHRQGIYPLSLPFAIGSEGAGTVSAVGPGVTHLSIGDRVGWANIPGSYAEKAVIAADRLVPIPNGISCELAAAAMLQGFTAHYLTRSTYQVKQGDTVLVHAGAGGMGQLLIQFAKIAGAKVLTTVSTDAKEKLAREAGADEVFRYENFVDAVKTAAPDGVDVVYDGVGAPTFEGGLEVLHPRGLMALYGAAGGVVPPVDPQILNRKGSLFLTRPNLLHYIAAHDELLWRADELFDLITTGALKVNISHRYPMHEAAQAHEDLEARRTTGKLLLIP